MGGECVHGTKTVLNRPDNGGFRYEIEKSYVRVYNMNVRVWTPYAIFDQPEKGNRRDPFAN